MQGISASASRLAAVLLTIAVGAGCGEAPTGGSGQPEVSASSLRFQSAPELIAPDDGATLSTGYPVLRWRLDRRHEKATVQVCSDAACMHVLQELGSKTGEAEPDGGLADGTYYWRVAWANGRARRAGWSDIRRFVIARNPPLVVTQDLSGVWAVARDDVWVVGASGTILHYNTSWRAEASPVAANLSSIWATDAGQAWAVGAAGTILQRVDGDWTSVASPTSRDLAGVWGSSADDVWAVGANGIILHWDGSSWVVHYDRGAGSFYSVSGRGSDDVWVVGSGRQPDGDYTDLAFHWDGTSWTDSPSCAAEGSRFAAGGFIAYLSDVWSVTGGSVWAAGGCLPGAALLTAAYVVRRDDDTWSRSLAYGGAPVAEHHMTDTIWASADDDVWAAPARQFAIEPGVPPLLHYDGTTWTAAGQEITVGIHDLGGTASDDIWAVGLAGTRMHYDGATWTSIP